MKIFFVLRLVLLLLAVIFFLPYSYAQKKIKSGTIVFEVTAVKTDVPELALMEGTQRTVTFSPSMVASQFNMKSGEAQIRKITDVKTQKETHLYAIGSKKYAVVYKTKPQPAAASYSDVSAIKYIPNSTKTIAGYICRKAEIIINDEKILLWVTDKIKAQLPDIQPIFPELEEFPLEYTLPGAHAQLTFTAQRVSENLPTDSRRIPDEYEILSEEEFKKRTGVKHLSF